MGQDQETPNPQILDYAGPQPVDREIPGREPHSFPAEILADNRRVKITESLEGPASVGAIAFGLVALPLLIVINFFKAQTMSHHPGSANWESLYVVGALGAIEVALIVAILLRLARRTVTVADETGLRIEYRAFCRRQCRQVSPDNVHNISIAVDWAVSGWEIATIFIHLKGEDQPISILRDHDRDTVETIANLMARAIYKVAAGPGEDDGPIHERLKGNRPNGRRLLSVAVVTLIVASLLGCPGTWVISMWAGE